MFLGHSRFDLADSCCVKAVYICADMEGLSGVDHWEQCYDPDDNSPAYLEGLRHLAADVHATVEGCVRAGVSDIRVLDGHGRNRQVGLTRMGLHTAARLMTVTANQPTRFPELDESVEAVLMVGQHAMAGTLHGFLDHTQNPKEICRYLINGEEHGELSQFALYAGAFGVPLVHVSGDEALCNEAQRLIDGISTTPTKKGLGWNQCALYAVEEVRARITGDVAQALSSSQRVNPFTRSAPLEIAVEFAWSGLADELASVPGVHRVHARTVSWVIEDLKDIYCWPSVWHPPKR